MKRNYLFLIICFIGIVFTSCSESGLEGPEGPAGPQGKTGDAGPIGSAGKDGSIIYSGVGAPTAALGSISDYYLDKGTGNLYGPKLVSGWGNSITLMGANGANGTNGANGANGTNGTNGTNGSVTLSGNGAPSAASGNTGDYYLDKASYQLYGPKSTAGWEIPILLRGADGAQGPAGAAGKDGSIIYSGSGVPVATIGVNGDYYLDQNTGNLYGPKTNAGWGVGLVLKGTNGTNGTNGANGANGANGTNGTNGSVTLSGNGAPAIGIGGIGDYYLDKTNYLLYGPKVAGGWGVPILLRGADGAQGPIGPAGANGTVIYSGEGAPASGLGALGDFYFSRLEGAMYGPKSNLGWGTGTNLKGTNGSSVLNGSGAPATTVGANGDFYINTTNYNIYGPKTAGVWGVGTPLAGGGGSGGGTNLLFETPDDSTFDWGYESSYYFDLSNLRMHKNGNYNDSTSFFNIPASALASAQNSLMLVYMRDIVTGWKQVVQGDTTFTGIFSRSKITPGSAFARIIERKNASYVSPSINKVRIVLVPYTNSGVISSAKGSQPIIPMSQMMIKLNIKESDFKKLN